MVLFNMKCPEKANLQIVKYISGCLGMGVAKELTSNKQRDFSMVRLCLINNFAMPGTQ